MKKFFYICKKFYVSFQDYLSQVDKGLQEIRNRGMGSKS